MVPPRVPNKKAQVIFILAVVSVIAWAFWASQAHPRRNTEQGDNTRHFAQLRAKGSEGHGMQEFDVLEIMGAPTTIVKPGQEPVPDVPRLHSGEKYLLWSTYCEQWAEDVVGCEEGVRINVQGTADAFLRVVTKKVKAP
jgi:hypothetical protein